jgi:hypothetical protein
LDLSQIPLTVSVDTLDFDLDYTKKCDLYEEGRSAAERFYRFEYIGPKNPSEINDILEFLEDGLLKGIGRQVKNLRINLALPVEPSRRKLRVLYRRNMEQDTDDRLVLGLEEGAIGRCWQREDNVLVDMNDAKSTFATKWKMTKYQQALVRTTVQTLLSIPVFEPEILDSRVGTPENRILAVLSIDSDDDLLEEFAPIANKDETSDLWLLVSDMREEIGKALRM